MHFPIRLTYSYDSQDFSFILDLYKHEDRTRVIGTLTWAASKGVSVTITPVEVKAVSDSKVTA